MRMVGQLPGVQLRSGGKPSPARLSYLENAESNILTGPYLRISGPDAYYIGGGIAR